MVGLDIFDLMLWPPRNWPVNASLHLPMQVKGIEPSLRLQHTGLYIATSNLISSQFSSPFAEPHLL